MAIVAFGMGVNLFDRQVVRFGMSSDISIYMYVQESGIAGRDGRPAMATLLKDHLVDDVVKEYVANSSICRRDVLFEDMYNCTPLNLDV